jgi:hypothetical protein
MIPCDDGDKSGFEGCSIANLANFFQPNGIYGVHMDTRRRAIGGVMTREAILARVEALY